MNTKSSKKSSSQFIVNEIDDEQKATKLNKSQHKSDTKIEPIIEEKTEIVEIHKDTERFEEEKVEEHKEEQIVDSGVFTESVAIIEEKEEATMGQTIKTSQDSEYVQVSEEKVQTPNDSKDYGVNGSKFVESMEINQEMNKDFDTLRSTIEQNNEKIDEILNEPVQISQEEYERRKAIENIKKKAILKTKEAIDKKTEANKMNKGDDTSNSEEFYTNLRKSLEIYNEGVRLIDSVLQEMVNLGLKNDKTYQDLLIEKRNLYSNIALAYQRLKNLDEALRYNNLVYIL
jgi:hypothetical protein